MSRPSGTAETSRCPACGGGELKSFGAPRIRHAGLARSQPTAVCRCLTCDLLFFVPILPNAALADHYTALAGEQWVGDSRPDWALVRHAILQRVRTGSVLDIGCWTGGFLASLPPEYEKLGVEPSLWARGRATDRGVTFVANSLDELVSTRGTYDVVTMIDVIEHMTAPFEALAAAAGRLKDRGVLIVTTGNSRALPWRLMPRDYWYYFAEHVCFFSERWFRWGAVRLGLQIDQVSRFSHLPSNHVWTPFTELARACACRLLGGAGALPFRLAQRGHLLRGPVETYHWPDHMLIVLRRRPPSARKNGLGTIGRVAGSTRPAFVAGQDTPDELCRGAAALQLAPRRLVSAVVAGGSPIAGRSDGKQPTRAAPVETYGG